MNELSKRRDAKRRRNAERVAELAETHDVDEISKSTALSTQYIVDLAKEYDIPLKTFDGIKYPLFNDVEKLVFCRAWR